MRFVRGTTRTRYYVGVLNEAPVYVQHSKDSITCELFFNYREARRHYAEVCRVEVEPAIKVIGCAEDTIPKPWYAKKEPLEEGYRKKWLSEWWYRMKRRLHMQWCRLKNFMGKG